MSEPTKSSFNFAQKRPERVDLPSGAIVSWNDMHKVFNKLVEYEKYIEVKKPENFPNIENELGFIRLINNFSRSAFTPTGAAYNAFRDLLLGRITDCAVALLVREGEEKPSRDAWPKDLRQQTNYAFYFSIPQLESLLDEVAFENADNDYLLKGVRPLKEFLEAVADQSLNYPISSLIGLNNPIPHSLLKNTLDDRIHRSHNSRGSDFHRQISV